MKNLRIKKSTFCGTGCTCRAKMKRLVFYRDSTVLSVVYPRQNIWEVDDCLEMSGDMSLVICLDPREASALSLLSSTSVNFAKVLRGNFCEVQTVYINVFWPPKIMWTYRKS